MARPSKEMNVSDEEVLHDLFQENEYGDISESEYSSESEINIKCCHVVNIVWALMKALSVTVARSMAYGLSQALSDHVFHSLASVA
jgi:hypothetical protein